MKKLILPIFIPSFFLISLFIFQNNTFAFFHDKNSSGGNDLDCYVTFKEFYDWGKGFQYVSDKKTISRQPNDYCEIKTVQNTGSTGTTTEDIVKITYYQDTDSLISAVEKLKSGEDKTFIFQDQTKARFAGRTNNIPAEDEGDTVWNYAKAAASMENCIVESIYRMNHYIGEGVWDASLEKVVGNLEGLEKNRPLMKFCAASGGQPKTQQPSQINQPLPQEVNIFKTALGGFPVFIGEWFKAVSTGISLVEFSNVVENDLKASGLNVDGILGRKPKISTEDIDKQRQEIKNQDSPFRMDILEGQVQIKLPGQNKWIDLKQGDKIPSGSTIFTGMDATTVLSIKGKGVLEVLPFTEITVSEQGLKQAASEGKTTTDLKLRTGDIEVNVEGGAYGASMQVRTPNMVAGVRGTHFWVSYDKDRKLSTVGVYEGKVEIKSSGRDKSALVSPNGDKPGLVLITQKLSVTKLALGGLVFVAVIVGVVLFLKRRRNRTFRAKKIK